MTQRQAWKQRPRNNVALLSCKSSKKSSESSQKNVFKPQSSANGDRLTGSNERIARSCNISKGSGGTIKASGEGDKANVKYSSGGTIKASGEGDKANVKYSSGGSRGIIKASEGCTTSLKSNSTGVIKANGEGGKASVKSSGVGIYKAAREGDKTNANSNNCGGIIKARSEGGKINAKSCGVGIIIFFHKCDRSNTEFNSVGTIKAGSQASKTNAKFNSVGIIKAESHIGKTSAKFNSVGIIKAESQIGKTSAKFNSVGIIKADETSAKFNSVGIIKAESQSGKTSAKFNSVGSIKAVKHRHDPDNISTKVRSAARNPCHDDQVTLRTSNVATMTDATVENFDQLPDLLSPSSFASWPEQESVSQQLQLQQLTSMFAASREPCQKTHKPELRQRMRQRLPCSLPCCDTKADFYCIDCDRATCQKCCWKEHGSWLPHRLLQWNSTMYGEPREEPQYILHCCSSASKANPADSSLQISNTMELVSQCGPVLARLVHCPACDPIAAMYFLDYLPLSGVATFVSVELLDKLLQLNAPTSRAVNFVMKFGTAKLFGRCHCRLAAAVAAGIETQSVLNTFQQLRGKTEQEVREWIGKQNSC